MKRTTTALFAVIAFGWGEPFASADEPNEAADAPAAPPPQPKEARASRLGDRGQLVIEVDRLVPLASYTDQSITIQQGATTTTVDDQGFSFAFMGREPGLGTVHTMPRFAIDFSVLEGLTVGTGLAFGVDVAGTHVETTTKPDAPRTSRATDSPRATMLGFAPRVGYVMLLGPSIALWPRAGFSFYSVTSKTEEKSNGESSTTSVTDTLLSLDLDARLLWTPIPHVFASLGPLVNVAIDGSHSTEFAQHDNQQSRSDDLSVFHIGASISAGAWLDL